MAALSSCLHRVAGAELPLARGGQEPADSDLFEVGAPAYATGHAPWIGQSGAPRAGTLALTSYAASPYQFVDSNCVQRQDKSLIMVSAQEREVLMGFPRDHTLPATRSREAKANPREEAAVRMSLVGNSWSVPVTAFLLSRILAEWGFLVRAPSAREVSERDTKHFVRHVTGASQASTATSGHDRAFLTSSGWC